MERGDFDRAFEVLIGHEGGYVNDPRDRGGETKFGISKRSHPLEDIPALTLDRAKAIYLADYWSPLSCDRMPYALALVVFDAAANNGAGQAARWLQGAVGVAEDGIVGPVTLRAVAARGVLDVAVEFHAARIQAMAQMGGWRVYGRGWSRRLVRLVLQSVGAL